MKVNGVSVINAGFTKKRYWLLGVCVLFLITNIAVIFYVTLLDTSTRKMQKFGLLDPAREFLGVNDSIVNFQPLRDYLNTVEKKHKNVSVYFEFLNTGANIAVNKDVEFFPASLLKVPVAMAAIKKIEKGEWKWTNELVLMATDKDDRFGNLYKESVGSRYTVEELIKKMLIESDNTAKYIILRNLDPEEAFEVYSHLGLYDFFCQRW